MVADVSIQLEDFHIPAPGYALIRQIKELDGRKDFLKLWVQEIEKHIKYSPGRYRDVAVPGDEKKRTLKVVEVKPTVVRTFNFAQLKQQKPAVYRRIVTVTPPKYARDIRISAALPGKRSHEWDALAKVGSDAQAKNYARREDWNRMSIANQVRGLFLLKEDKLKFGKEHDVLFDELKSMANEGEWGDHLFGKSDGRLILKPNKPIESLVDREAALKEYGQYVKISTRSGTTSVTIS